jgi:tetratricopeptide (TPR) repeat protein
MRADLIALGIRLGWVVMDDEEEMAVDTVMERLRNEGEGVLLIFDNAVDANALNTYLPRGGAAKVLVTSNAPHWRGVAEPVEIRVWTEEIGADYLIARTGRARERGEAQALSQQLGGLPLAHEQAAAYCERLEISFAEYRRRFEATPVRLLDYTSGAPAEYRDGLTVAKTFVLAIEEAAQLNPAAEPLIVLAALLAQEAIPLFLFSEAREKFGEPLVTTLAGDGLDEAVAALRTFALIDKESVANEQNLSITHDAIRLHPLVREIAGARREHEARYGIRNTFIAALRLIYPADPYSPSSWPRCALLNPHVFAIYETQEARLDANVEFAELLSKAARYCVARAAYSEGRPLLERALTIREKVQGPEHPDTAMCLNNLAILLHEQGEVAAALPLFKRALAIYEHVRGPEHPDTATTLNNLARLLQVQGDHAAARPLHERALAIHEKMGGAEHPDTAACIHSLAVLFHAQGKLVEARPLYERALEIREKVLGPEHRVTSLSLGDLASLVHAQGDLVAARPL